MEKQQILNFLNKYNYTYTESNKNIIVKLDFSQRIYINLDEENKIKISDKLTGWNFLTGIIEMSLKNAMLYNFIGAIIIGIMFFCFQLESQSNILIPIYLVFILWVLMFTFYYLVKLENFKTRIMNLQK